MLRKSKLILAFMPFMLVSCNKQEFQFKWDDTIFYYAAPEGGSGDSSFICLPYVGTTGSKKVKKDLFYAKDSNGNKIACSVITNSMHLIYPYWYYTACDEIELKGSSEMETGSVYVGFDTNTIKNSNYKEFKYYIGSNEITTSYKAIKI